MFIGKVVGTVTSTKKHALLTGCKFMIIQPYTGGSQLVAIDDVGAGTGDVVIVAQGSAARLGACASKELPIDALIIGIVDDPEKICAGSNS